MIIFLFAQVVTDSTTTGTLPDWAAGLESFAKLTAALVAVVVAILGLPVAYLQTQKTRAEIRKLELEAADLTQKLGPGDTFLGGHRISIDNITDSRVDIQILADPRFLGPLLVLLDFIVVWVLLTIANYGFEIIPFRIYTDLILAALSAVLLIPVLRNALRLRSTLRAAGSDQAERGQAVEKGG
jgi:hypothetical protein